jgi:hypothetical protein
LSVGARIHFKPITEPCVQQAKFRGSHLL